MHLIQGVVAAEHSDELSEHASEGQNKSCVEASGHDEAPLDVSSATVMAATASLVVTLSALASTISVLALYAMTTLALVASLLALTHSISVLSIFSKVTTSLALVNLKNLGETHGLFLLAFDLFFLCKNHVLLSNFEETIYRAIEVVQGKVFFLFKHEVKETLLALIFFHSTPHGFHLFLAELCSELFLLLEILQHFNWHESEHVFDDFAVSLVHFMDEVDQVIDRVV